MSKTQTLPFPLAHTHYVFYVLNVTYNVYCLRLSNYYAQVKKKTFALCLIGRKFTCAAHISSRVKLLIAPFQKHPVADAERKSRPELQSNEPGIKREVKGSIC